MVWPDIVVGLLLAFGAFRGWRVGLIGELRGTVAFAAAVVAAFTYPGTWDGFAHDRTGLGPGSAHVLALLAYAAAAYAVVFMLGFALGRIAKLPIIGIVNAALGASIGIVKTTIFAWAILYVALFFPLSHELRDDLHRSRAVAVLESPNERFDATLRSSLPWFVRPYSSDIFARHHV